MTEEHVPYSALGLVREQLVPTVIDEQNEPSRQRLLARIELFDESIIMTHFAGGKAVKAHEVAPDDLASAFSDIPLTTGLLPVNCLFFARSGSLTTIGIYQPPAMWKLRVVMAEEREYMVPLPGLVFVGRGRAYYVWAARGRIGTADSADDTDSADGGLYRAPFPNVYDTGRICPGNVTFPECGERTIWKALKLFLESDFNADLRNGKSLRYKDDVTQQWATLNCTGDYPLDDLVPSRSPDVVSDLLTMKWEA